ncbi:hypothetical protein SAMN02745164_01146 [Marinitoga hydrogenitolerans DSM 16785]|uniref:Uncharacterized protein n=1 Tax=Marinitoga hydrogenitolerans (strain DSM 16785 / JCM 12826 / AT1271) TaxID=1122195 RepID=A0A1M4WBX5_MARH1|nr:hypothetical protein [Marinitoga hydrogenitolerans]SHE78781.1 hypothetical protein SAMN02745164_01146 [Marinitoga hydrogenitolerans DSM 16785]
MKLNFLALQFNPLNTIEDNLEFIEGIMDFVYHKKLSFFFINGNPFKNSSISEEELEQIDDFLSAISDYNNCTIITAQTYNKKYQLFIQKPYENLEIKKSIELELNDGKKIFINTKPKNCKNILNVIINPNFEISNVESLSSIDYSLYLTQPLLGKTKIKIGDQIWIGGNTEGYLFFSW